MILFKYPNNDVSWLAGYNRRVERDNFAEGTFGLAFDVFRDNGLLFSSYSAKQSEPIDTFTARNYPDIEHVDFAHCAMGAGPQVKGVDRFPVPTWAAIDHAISLTSIRLILAAALATATYPRVMDEKTERVPTKNALRQRFHNAESDWFRVVVNWPEENAAIRAIIAKSSWVPPLIKPARWDVKLLRRGERTRIGGDLMAMDAIVEAPDGDMTRTVERAPVLRQVKKALDVTGIPARIISKSAEGFVAHLDTEPFNISVQRIESGGTVKPKLPTKGFSL